MTRVSALVANLIADESGQELVEYNLIVAKMASATIATLHNLASCIATTFSGIGTRTAGAV